MFIKYCETQHNPAKRIGATIRLGTVSSFRTADSTSGTFDGQEGLLIYKIRGPVPLTPDFSRSYLGDAITCDGNNGLSINAGIFDAAIQPTLSDGPNGWLLIQGDDDIRLDFTKTFFIFCCSQDSKPSIEKARRIKKSYDSYYQILDLDKFSKRVAYALTLRFRLPIGIRVKWCWGPVNYKDSKSSDVDEDVDSSIPFSDRVLKTIFNKNTYQDHEYQSETRVVFWLSDVATERWLPLSEEPVDLAVPFVRRHLCDIT